MLSTAVADTSIVLGPNSVGRELLVSQTSADFLSTVNVDDIRAYEASIPDGTRYLPRTSQTDVPVGRFFNGYGAYVGVNASQSSDSDLWERLYFPGIMGQDGDIGQDSEATIAFWMRAGRTTRGFPVATTDNMQTDAEVSPLLDRLQRMIVAGTMDASSWFADDWSVYWAVFVDGYSQRIHFVAAGPPGWSRVGFDDESVFETVWDAASLGITRIFTNRWHHIAIVLEVPVNGDQSGVGVGLVLRLVVDGETYSGSQGFLRCLPRQLDFISPLWEVNIPDPQHMRIKQGGTMVVGNINAGLYGVMVTSTALAQADIIALGTVPMNNFFNINTAKFFALGFYVTFIAVALLCMMSVGIGVEYISERRKRLTGESMAADLAYMAVVGTSITAEKFKIAGRDFRLLPVDTLKALLGLENTIFATLLTEIEKLAISADGARADLAAIVWIRGQENYIPTTPQFAAMRDQFKTSEKADLSHDGHFFIPQVLWNDFIDVTIDFWHERIEERSIEEDMLKQAATGKKMQVKVAKVKVSKAGGKSGGKSAGGKGGKGGRGTSMRKLTNTIKINAAAPLQMIQPVILALQAAGSYLTNFAVPVQFQGVLTSVFQFFTFKWISFSLPDLFFAVMLFALSVAVTILLFYFCISDHDEWLAFVGKYAAKRDRLDRAKIRAASEPPKSKSQKKQLLVALGNDEDLADDDLFNDKYVGVSMDVDQFHQSRINRDESSSDDDEPKDTDTQAATNLNGDGTPRTMPIAPIVNWFDPMLRHILPITITIPMDEFIDGSRRSNLITVRRNDVAPGVCPKKRMKWEIEYDNAKKLYVAYDAANHAADPHPIM
ncbi:transmembrane protein, putative, partial [Bodo saltans]